MRVTWNIFLPRSICKTTVFPSMMMNLNVLFFCLSFRYTGTDLQVGSLLKFSVNSFSSGSFSRLRTDAELLFAFFFSISLASFSISIALSICVGAGVALFWRCDEYI